MACALSHWSNQNKLQLFNCRCVFGRKGLDSSPSSFPVSLCGLGKKSLPLSALGCFIPVGIYREWDLWEEVQRLNADRLTLGHGDEGSKAPMMSGARGQGMEAGSQGR